MNEIKSLMITIAIKNDRFLAFTAVLGRHSSEESSTDTNIYIPGIFLNPIDCLPQ